MMRTHSVDLDQRRSVLSRCINAGDIRERSLALHKNSKSQAVHQVLGVGQRGSELDWTARCRELDGLDDRYVLLVDVDEREFARDAVLRLEREVQVLIFW